MQRPSQETVKVQNLSKKTSHSDIFKILMPLSLEVDIFVNVCQDQPVNYAYVNCHSYKNAQYVIQKLHHLSLHGNKLTAKMKEGRKIDYPLSIFRKSPSPVFSRMSRSRNNSQEDISAPSAKKSRIENFSDFDSVSDPQEKGAKCDSASSIASSASSSASSTSTDRTIKVSITDVVGINGSDLDSYFSVFGQLTGNTIIRQGQPSYAYVNFENEKAAKAACRIPDHTICGKWITVKPKSSSAANAPPSTLGLTPAVLTCNPLVINQAQSDMAKHFDKSKFVQISPLDDHVVIYAPEALIAKAKSSFAKIIHDNEAKIRNQQICLSFYHYPLLKSKKIHEQIHKNQSKFELKIECCGKKMSFDQFQEDWKNMEKQIVEPGHDMRSSFSTESYYQWYWHNDDTFVAYGSKVNKQIESAFQANSLSLEVSIGSNNYVIDISNNSQINTATGKIRNIQRRLVHSKKNSNLALHLTCHNDHVSQIESHIVKFLDSFITEKNIQLSDSIQELEVFVEQLIDLCSKNLIDIVWDKEKKSLCLKGVGTNVNIARQEIQARIIAKERELGRISLTHPTSWTPQDDNCELKLVPRESNEWKFVEKKFTESLHKNIVKIERIQNKWLWEVYAQAKDRMLKKNATATSKNETILFHGTRHTPPKHIYKSEQGFDHRMASKGLYGEGAYFAVKSSYSAEYAHQLHNGHKQMFLVKVLTGVPYESPNCDLSLKAPPKKPQTESRTHGFEGERYDSVTAFTNGSRIYVIYEQGKVYPDYLITYADSYTF